MPIDTTYQDTIVPPDTIYGISTDVTIPIRQTETITLEVKRPIEKLFDLNPLVVEVANWQVLILLGAVLLFGFVKAFSNNRFNQGIKALLNYTVAQEITREEKVFFHRSNIFFTLIHLMTLSLFVFQLKELLYSSLVEVNKFSFFLLILTFFAGMYFVKYIFSRLLLFVFNDSSIAQEYIFNVSLYNNLLGAVFIPVLCITYFTAIPFQSILICLAIPILFIVFFLRFFRVIQIGRTKRVSYFYIFVYICSLEILPLVVLYRIFILK